MLEKLSPYTTSTVTAPLAWSAYIAIPASGWGWLNGLPLGLAEASALALVWWAWAAGRQLPGVRILAALIVVKLALAGVFVDRGFAARYYANDAWAAPIEQSILYRGERVTRRDDRLRFGTDDGPDLPLHFYNDVRFNFFGPDQPQRTRLAYSVEWNGFIHVDDNKPPATFYLAPAVGATADLSIDRTPVLPLDAGTRRSHPIALDTGWHAISVRVRAPYGADRTFDAGEIVEDAARPFDGTRVLLQPAGYIRLAIDTTLRWVTSLVDAGVLAGLGVLVWGRARRAWSETRRGNRVGHLLWLGAIGEGLLFAQRHAADMVVLTGGDDWLGYESFSRAIALGDWIVAGQAAPFYYQPLYSYFLAVTHLLFGDGLFGAVLVQRLLLAATVGWVATITRDLFGQRAGWIALGCGGAFLYIKVGPWTNVPLSEMLFIPLLAGWVALLVRMAAHGASAARAAAAGIVGGLATLTRSTLLLAWPPMLLLWGASLRAGRRPMLTALLIPMIAVVGMATLRNWIVADRFVLVASSLGANLEMGNLRTHPLEPTPVARSVMYDRLGLDDNVRTVVEFAVQAPGEFAQGLGNKALYTIGFFRLSRLPGGDNMRTSWLYVGMWALALAGVARIRRGSPPVRNAAIWLPATAAMGHFVFMVLVIPFGYSDRLILPLYPLLIPYAAFAVEPLPAIFGRLVRSAPAVLALARRNAATHGGWAQRHASRLALAIRRHPRSWLYLAYTAAVVHWLEWRPEGSDRLDLPTALLLPVITLTVWWLAQRVLVHRLLCAALFAGALVRVATRGSLSAEALYDPLFWGVVGAVALGVSAATGRWPIAARAAGAVAGASTMTSLLLPAFPGADASVPIADSLGIAGVLFLAGLWIQAAVPPATLLRTMGPAAAALRGALAAALVLVVAGAQPAAGAETSQWIAALAIMLGLAEATGTKGHYADINDRATRTISSS